MLPAPDLLCDAVCCSSLHKARLMLTHAQASPHARPMPPMASTGACGSCGSCGSCVSMLAWACNGGFVQAHATLFKHTLHVIINLNLKHHSHDQAPPSQYTRTRIWYRLARTPCFLPLTSVDSEVCVPWEGSCACRHGDASCPVECYVCKGVATPACRVPRTVGCVRQLHACHAHVLGDAV